MKISFVAGFGPIVADTETSKNFYGGALGIVFIEEPGGYLHTGDLPGVQHFALWPLAQAAESCFGVDRWPSEVPAPTSWIEFDVEDVAACGQELEERGYALLVANREEPWGQTVTRMLSPEGILTGLTYTPHLR
jgi:catechol 2,3-dioxygenase-like lactoylglutathione lyase family enzyme